MQFSLSRRAVLAGSAIAVALPAAAVQAMSAPATTPVVAAWREWLELQRAEERRAAESDRRLAALPEELRRARVFVGGAMGWAHSEDQVDVVAASPRWASERVRAAKLELQARRRAVDAAHAEAGLPALAVEIEALGQCRHALGYELVELAGPGPVDAAAIAWVAAASLDPGAEWSCLPAAAFAAQLRAALPVLPEDLRQAVEAALSAEFVEEGFCGAIGRAGVVPA